MCRGKGNYAVVNFMATGMGHVAMSQSSWCVHTFLDYTKLLVLGAPTQGKRSAPNVGSEVLRTRRYRQEWEKDRDGFRGWRECQGHHKVAKTGALGW
jgi:hypothetical protein